MNYKKSLPLSAEEKKKTGIMWGSDDDEKKLWGTLLPWRNTANVTQTFDMQIKGMRIFFIIKGGRF